jgi:hypothetical protein
MADAITLGSVVLALPLQHGAALIVDGNGANVAVCLGDINTSENTARLFAASPNLLLAAEAFLKCADRNTVEANALRTICARARGQETT